MSGIKLVQGGGDFWTLGEWPSEKAKAYLDALAAGGVKEIDSAQAYGDSELVIGNNEAGKRFELSTKVPGVMVSGSFRRKEVVSRTKTSLERLQVKQIDVLYLHSPDPAIPIEETLSGIQDLYADGVFRRFGISNYTPEDVRKIYDHQKLKGWVLPTVYQGNYNAVARSYEATLFPTLRELGISFYAYSPAAGGFLAKSKQQILDGAGRFSKESGPVGEMYNALYNRPSLMEALGAWGEIAKDAQCTPYILAIRWVTYNSPLNREQGDAIIIGAKTVERLQQVFDGVNQGPLSEDIVKRIDAMWETVRHEAPVSNFDV